MKKGLKIAAITVGVIIILMFLLPFAFQGKIADIVKTEGNKMLNAQFDFRNLNISLFRNFPQASVTLEDFWLKGTGEFANDTLTCHCIAGRTCQLGYYETGYNSNSRSSCFRRRSIFSFQSEATTLCYQKHEPDL